ncbi:MAG: T9SS type A sorting domain-containing protein [Bacteroidales bacterium]
MKKLFYRNIMAVLIVSACFSVSPRSNAQQVLNSSFEDWTLLTLFEEPTGFITTNFQSFLTTGQPNVSRSTDACNGNYALRLETVSFGSEMIPGGIFIGAPGPDGIAGGIPYTGHPEQVQICLRHDLNPGDTGAMMVIFKTNGWPVGTAFFQFYDSVPIYNYWVINIDWVPDIMPDSVMFVFFTTMPDMTFSPGSVAYLDEILMLGATEQLPNNDFENWNDLISEEPDHWYTSNAYTLMGSGPSIEKSTDHFDGQYSVKLINKVSVGGDTISFITNGIIGENGPAGGSPVTQNPSHYSFYYKYQPVGNDSALAMGVLWAWNPLLNHSVILDSVMIQLTAQSTWTYQELNFNYTQFPLADTITIAFAAGNINDYGPGVELGSTLWVDKVKVEYGPIGMPEPEDGEIRLFPNPVTDKLSFSGLPARGQRIEVLSLDGKLLRSFTYAPGVTFDLSDLGPGCYIFRIVSGSSVSTGKFVKLI